MRWNTAGFVQPGLGFGRAPEFGRKHARMHEEPRVHGALGQRLLHVRPRLVVAAGGAERPRQRIVRKNVRAILQFALRQLNRQFCLLAPRGQEQRKSPRIALCAELLQVRFDFRGFVSAARRAERVGQRPLKFRQRIDLRRTLRGRNRLGDSISIKQHAAPHQKGGGIVGREA